MLIALLEDESETQQVIFVDNAYGQEERFIGLGTPASIHRALASKFPNLEIAYQYACTRSLQTAMSGEENSISFLVTKVQNTLGYFLRNISNPQIQKQEFPNEINIFEIWVSSRELESWLTLANNSVRLRKDQIEKLQTNRKFTSSLLSIIINQANDEINTFRIDTSTRFLAINQGEKLILIVDLLQLAVITAAESTSKS